jgi:hypothetical protein
LLHVNDDFTKVDDDVFKFQEEEERQTVRVSFSVCPLLYFRSNLLPANANRETRISDVYFMMCLSARLAPRAPLWWEEFSVN